MLAILPSNGLSERKLILLDSNIGPCTLSYIEKNTIEKRKLLSWPQVRTDNGWIFLGGHLILINEPRHVIWYPWSGVVLDCSLHAYLLPKM